jgi:hypothetical protein
VWSGQDGTGAVRALETCQVASVVAAYHIEPDAQSWQRYFRARGEMSNLKTFDNMQGVMALGGTTAVATPIVNQTTHGVIEWDEVWRDEIHIIGDILVEDRSTLTIEPGTKVLIAANQDVDNLVDDPFAMRQGIQNTIPDEGIGGVHFGEPYRDEGNHISILVVGTLQAVGTPEQMITITSDSATPGIYDWNSLDIYHGALSYSTVEYYRVLQIDGGVEVTHNILRHVGECAVCCGITPCSVLIEGNAISYAGHELLGTTGAPLIRGNHLRQQAGRTCFAGDGSPQIIGNTFEDCGHGIEFTDPPDAPVIEDNTFIDCGQDIGHNY